MTDGEFVVEGAKLTVRVNLAAGWEEELREACDRILDRPEHEFTVDLSAVEYVHSLSVGVLSYAWVEALSREKEMVFVVSQAVADVFERTGLSKVFTYRLAGREGAAGAP